MERRVEALSPKLHGVPDLTGRRQAEMRASGRRHVETT
jgi:hypothetical protein